MGERSALDQISTCWPAISDPVQFTYRYASAIQNYLDAILRDSHEAEEVLQDFLVRGLEQGFLRTDALRGRFRDYLKTSVKNAALAHLRKRKPNRAAALDANGVADDETPGDILEAAWLADWRRCLLERVWDGLEQHQRRQSGNLAHTVLQLVVDHPGENSEQLSARASAAAGRSISPVVFRKQLSRARRIFAELLVKEVSQSLQDPTPERVCEELVEVGLLPQIRDYLPADWTGAPI